VISDRLFYHLRSAGLSKVGAPTSDSSGQTKGPKNCGDRAVFSFARKLQRENLLFAGERGLRHPDISPLAAVSTWRLTQRLERQILSDFLSVDFKMETGRVVDRSEQ
jgi:hypothetical protein